MIYLAAKTKGLFCWAYSWCRIKSIVIFSLLIHSFFLLILPFLLLIFFSISFFSSLFLLLFSCSSHPNSILIIVSHITLHHCDPMIKWMRLNQSRAKQSKAKLRAKVNSRHNQSMAKARHNERLVLKAQSRLVSKAQNYATHCTEQYTTALLSKTLALSKII